MQGETRFSSFFFFFFDIMCLEAGQFAISYASSSWLPLLGKVSVVLQFLERL